MLDIVRLEGETEELVEQVKELGLRYGIVTPYTSMLIISDVDNDVTVNMSFEWQLRATSGYVGLANADSMKYYTQGNEAQHANVAVGGNIVIRGNATFVEVDGVYLDLRIIGDIPNIDLGNDTIHKWIESNINITRVIEFGSEAFFNLAAEGNNAEILSVGSDAVISNNGEIIRILPTNNNGTSGGSPSVSGLSQVVVNNSATVSWTTSEPCTSLFVYRNVGSATWKVLQVENNSTNHTIDIDEMEDGDYLYYITITDSKGNITTYDNDGSYYQLSTVDVNAANNEVVKETSNDIYNLIFGLSILIGMFLFEIFGLVFATNKGEDNDQ
jgi:hypothetical protein